MSYLITFLAISALIFFHELGHYAMARAVGVYVEVFSIGFGKRIAGFRWLGTDWQFSAIPVGGYVRMKGQDDLDPTKTSPDPDSYNAQRPSRRIAILFAGPAANFILAFVLFFFVGLAGPEVLAPVVGEVLDESPAKAAGLQKADRIVAIDGERVATWDAMSKRIAQDDTVMELTIERGAYVQMITITPKPRETENIFGETVTRPMIGIAPANTFETLNLGVAESLVYAAEQTWYASKLIYQSVEKLITGVIPTSQLGGVITIVSVTDQASQNGWMSLFFITALISVNLGILNLFPIPALDGGHIVFNLYEMITRHAPSEAVLMKLTIVGWGLLLGLMSLGLYNDINRLMQ